MSTLPFFRYNIGADAIEGFSGTSAAEFSLRKAADHLFVIYLRGAISKWKQPVGYLMKQNSPSTTELKEIINEVITSAFANGKRGLAGFSIEKLLRLTLYRSYHLLIATTFNEQA